MGNVVAVGLALACLYIGISSGNLFQGLLTALCIGGMAWLAFVYNPNKDTKLSILERPSASTASEKSIANNLGHSITEDILAAAEIGNLNALVLVGCAYLSGSNGLLQDVQKAGSYLLKAAERNHYFASFVMAGLYREGLGVQRDVHKAYSWGLQSKRAIRSEDDDRVFREILLTLSSKGNETVLKVINGAYSAQKSFPRRDGEVAISHEKMAKKLLRNNYSTMRGVIGQCDTRPFIFGRGPFPVPYVEYVQVDVDNLQQTSWPRGDVLGYLKNMKPGDILIIPGWAGTRRCQEEDESYDLSDDGWIPHRSW